MLLPFTPHGTALLVISVALIASVQSWVLPTNSNIAPQCAAQAIETSNLTAHEVVCFPNVGLAEPVNASVCTDPVRQIVALPYRSFWSGDRVHEWNSEFCYIKLFSTTGRAGYLQTVSISRTVLEILVTCDKSFKHGGARDLSVTQGVSDSNWRISVKGKPIPLDGIGGSEACANESVPTN